jgi:hypothetical protein
MRPSTVVNCGLSPRNHLRVRVRLQPGGEVVRAAVGQQVNRSAGGHVDDDAAIVAAFAEREVVDADHRHGAGLGHWQCPDQPKQRRAGQRRPPAAGSPATRPITQADSDLLQDAAQQQGRRAYGVVTPGTCSANVLRRQAVLSQKNRRTRTFSSEPFPS